MKTPKLLVKPKERSDGFLRDFEWTWTKAIVVAFSLTAFTLATTVFIPSFWTYYSEANLGWSGPTDIEAAVTETGEFIASPTAGYQDVEWSNGDKSVFVTVITDPSATLENLAAGVPVGIGQQIRDVVAMGLTLGPLITILAVATIMQNWRRKLRGTSDKRPAGGYK